MIVNDAAAHKAQLRDYFDGTGFDRWSAIYRGDEALSYIRRTVQIGHAQMLATAQRWLLEACVTGTVLDAGCGTGLFSISMAGRGFEVTAADMSPRMVAATCDGAVQAGVGERVTCLQSDVESVCGAFDAVACFDVLVHYPRELFAPICTHLAQQAQKTFLMTYAPYSRSMAALHWIGGFFPQGQRRTEIQMIPDAVVEAALAQAGMRVRRTAKISHGFYHVTLLQAVRD